MPVPMPLPPEFMDWITSLGLLVIFIGALLYILWILAPALRNHLQEGYAKDAGQPERNSELNRTMVDLLEEIKMLRREIEELRRELRE